MNILQILISMVAKIYDTMKDKKLTAGELAGLFEATMNQTSVDGIVSIDTDLARKLSIMLNQIADLTEDGRLNKTELIDFIKDFLGEFGLTDSVLIDFSKK